MEKDQLLSRANAISVPEFGKRITERMLHDWVNEELVSKAIPCGRVKGGKGQDWQWTEDHIEQILQVCRLMGADRKPKSYIRVAQWFEGENVAFDLLVPALIAEFRRSRKKRMHKITVAFDPEADRHMRDSQKKRLVDQIGKVPASLNYPIIFTDDNEKINGLQMVAAQDAVSNVHGIISRILDAFEAKTEEMQIAFDFEGLLKAAMEGLYADPEFVELTAETAIKNATQEQLLYARHVQKVWLVTIEKARPLLDNTGMSSQISIDKFETIFSNMLPRLKEWQGQLDLFGSILMLIQRQPQLVHAIQEAINPHVSNILGAFTNNLR